MTDKKELKAVVASVAVVNAVQALEAQNTAMQVELDAFKSKAKASHAALWKTVHAEHPELDVDSNYQLDCDKVGEGIVLISVPVERPNSLEALLTAVAEARTSNDTAESDKDEPTQA